jgi:hypothetical protein
MKQIKVFFEDAEHEELSKLKIDYGLTWKDAVILGLRGQETKKKKEDVDMFIREKKRKEKEKLMKRLVEEVVKKEMIN